MRAPQIIGQFRISAILAVAALLGASGALPTQSPPSALQKQEAALFYVRCLSEAARTHDDKTLGVNAVAQEILPLCRTGLTREEQAFGAGLSAKDWAAYKTDVAQAQPALALNAVTSERAGETSNGVSVAVTQ